MLFTSPTRIAFSICGFEVYTYGVLMALGILIAISTSNYFANKSNKISKNVILDITPTLLLCGIIGARLYYCLLNYSYYSNHILEIFAIRNGGLAIHGALLGGTLAIIYSSKKYKLSFFKLTDYLVLGLPLGQCIARWGNFFNSEAFGLPCSLPWKLYIAPEYRPADYINYNYFHPTFLYESILDFFIFLILFFIHKKNSKSGIITLTYLILYSIIRILIETIRIDGTQYIFGIAFPIIASIIILIISIILLLIKIRN